MPTKPLALESELYRFRDKLLDSSLRNPLLNYRISKRKTIEVSPTNPDEVFQRLVVGGDWLRIAPSPGIDPDQATSTESLSPKQPDPEFSPMVENTLVTTCSEEKFDGLLRSVQRDANTSIEETGINYLHLAIGFLYWSDSNTEESELRRAPLILIPIQLTQSIQPRGGLEYKITWNEDELQSNTSLRKKLEADFAIQLPEYDDTVPPSAYLAQVQTAIRSRPSWKVQEDMLLGFFSFHKLSMFVDLDPTLWSASTALDESSLASRLISGNEISGGSGLYAPDYQIDEHPIAQSIELPLDADSSQLSALADIAEGRSIVIEGPPGTGKSQTIANAIANALEQGKTILFVAEKLAALEVVHKRLSQAGLAEFCLELHGHAVSPKKVYESLEYRLGSSQLSETDSSKERNHHEGYRTKLYSYLAASNKRVGPYNEPLYDLFWRVVQLRQCDVPLLRDLDINCSVDQPAFEEAIQSLDSFATASRDYDLPKESSWWGFFPQHLTPTESDRIVQLLPRLEQIAMDLEQCICTLSPSVGSSEADIASFLCSASTGTIAPLLSNPPPKPGIGIVSLLDPSTQTSAIEVQELLERDRRAKSLIEEHLEPTSRSHESVLQTLAGFSIAPLQTLPSNTEIGKLGEFSAWTHQVETLLEKLTLKIQELKKFGFSEPVHLEDLERSINAVHLVQHSAVQGVSELPMDWFSDATRKLISDARRKSEELVGRRKEIQEYIHLPSVPDPERLLFLIKQYRTSGGSWFRWFSGGYRALLQELRQFVSFPKGMTHSQSVALLESLYSFDKDLRAFQSSTTIVKILGNRFQGIETDWESLKVLSDWVHTAKRMGLDHRRANSLIAMREELVDSISIPETKQWIQALDVEFKGPCAEKLAIEEGWNRKVRLQELVSFVAEWKKRLQSIEAMTGHLKLGSRTSIQDFANCVHSAKIRQECADGFERIRREGGEVTRKLLNESVRESIDFRRTIQWINSLVQAGVPKSVFSALEVTDITQGCSTILKGLQDFERTEANWEVTRQQIVGTARVDSTWMAFRDAEGSPRLRLRDEAHQLQSEASRLPAWLAFCRTLERCKRSGVDEFAMAAATDKVDESRLSDAYRLALFHRLAELELNSNEIGFHFTSAEMNDLRANFQRLDRLRIQSKQTEIANTVRQRHIPEGNAKGRVGEYTELALIRHEIGKRSRHCKIRELMLRAGKAVQALKPCFLMSPLSLAKYLPAGEVEFDMVIMDEASQIKPEDAIGAILRAKQLVVVGDPKQLPPTSFFDNIEDEIDDEEATQLDNAESVLEVAQRSFQPYRRLRWHYRSQHESLIQFSNVNFYDEDLVVFPSPGGSMSGLGITYHQVEGATCIKGENLLEAQRIVERIVEHAKQRNGESLGVAAFNKKQSEMIDTLVLKACDNDPEFAALYSQMREGEDGFFVKNLENIQGDERDVIFISYTYGPDKASGKVAQRFGPINSEMGWRRLNVMVTRARKRMEVFASMLPSDIHGGPDKSRGVNAYRDFLEYASRGVLREIGSESGREPGSPFEESVARVVESAGLEAVFQVGVAGYFIDIGVRRREGDRSFLLGIECDGATYHSSKSARDRDRLREEIIKGRGWNLYRIWSTDWFLNQKAEEDRLIRRLKECIL